MFCAFISHSILLVLLVVLAPASSAIEIIGDATISQQLKDSFGDEARDMVKAIGAAWDVSAEYAEFTAAFMVSSQHLPSSEEFQGFTSQNKYWNSDNTIHRIQWVPEVSNTNRWSFEAQAGQVIFSYNATGGRVPKRANSSAIYYPILYCAPLGQALIGLDLSDGAQGDAISAIRRAKALGQPSAATPFRLRAPTAPGGFDSAATLFVPVFAPAAPPGPAGEFLGSVASVVLLQAGFDRI